MLNIKHFREQIIRPTLEHLDMHTAAAENLVLGTAVAESNLTHLVQLGGVENGGRGFFQMEEATEADIWETYLSRRRDIAAKVPADRDLVGNLKYATAMCRIHYWRRPEPLPHAEDADGMGAYWKQHYNTREGAGRVDGFVRDFEKYVL